MTDVPLEEVERALAKDTFRLGDLEVRRLGFGAMRITGEGIWGPPDAERAAKRLLHRVVELGVNLMDTADSYGPHVSERLIGEAFPEYPDDLVVATKGGLVRPGPGKWPRNGKPAHLRDALDGSLKRLHVDRIDVYQFHAPDPDVPFEDSMNAIAEMRDDGKIRHVGVCNVSVDELEQARGIVPIVSVQNEYNLAWRESEDVLERCEELGIGFIPWFPLGAAELLKPGTPVADIAERVGATPAQVSLAWLLKRSPVMLPIPGTSSVEHLEQNVRAITVELADDDFQALEEAGRKTEYEP